MVIKIPQPKILLLNLLEEKVRLSFNNKFSINVILRSKIVRNAPSAIILNVSFVINGTASKMVSV